jgi:hypothetical protein
LSSYPNWPQLRQLLPNPVTPLSKLAVKIMSELMAGYFIECITVASFDEK